MTVEQHSGHLSGHRALGRRDRVVEVEDHQGRHVHCLDLSDTSGGDGSSGLPVRLCHSLPREPRDRDPLTSVAASVVARRLMLAPLR